MRGRLASLLFEQVCKSVELEECCDAASTPGVQEEGDEKKGKKGLLSFLARKKNQRAAARHFSALHFNAMAANSVASG